MIANINLKRNVEDAVKHTLMITEYSDFLVVYLLHSKKGIVKITNLTLSLNNIPITINDIGRLWCVTSGNVEIVNHQKNSVRVRLTSNGYIVADIFTYSKPIIKRTYLRRFVNLLNILFKEFKELFLDLVYFIFHKKTYAIIKGTGVILGIIVAVLTIIVLGKQIGLF